MAQSSEGQAGGTSSLTECSLCLSTFTKPKCLPCIHTFCLTCLNMYVEMNTEKEEDKENVKLPCPLCRKEFSIPPQGLDELPNNFFINNIIELEKSILFQTSILDQFLQNEFKVKRNQLGRFNTEKKFLITIGLNVGDSTEQKICRISLDNPDMITVINSTPAQIKCESAACVINNNLYAVGIGRARNETWAWSAEGDEWTRLANMTSGRRRHCVTSVGDKIYALGGWVDADKRTPDSILCYDMNCNTWIEPGKLCHAVRDATCLTYKHCIYVFGGVDKNDKAVNHVQVYNTATGTSSLSSNPMPEAYILMRAVLWRSKALLIGDCTCYIYDFESDMWQKRKKFKTDVVHFGLTVDDDKLYISGGGDSNRDENNKLTWTRRDDVMSLSVEDFVSDNAEAKWKHHAKLPDPALIHLYSPVAMLK